MPMAQEARKPMFYVKPADGAIGAHTSTVKKVDRDFQNLAKAIAIANRCPHPLNYRKMCKYS